MTVPRRYADIQRGELRRIVLAGEHSSCEKDAVTEWETEFARSTGRKHAIAVDSGRMAMSIILKSLRLRDGSEIIIPAYTLKDLIPIIQSLNLKPVPADIDTNTFNMAVDAVSRRLTAQTRVILATHLFGNPCPMRNIMDLASARGLSVIEDCAHSAGAGINGKKTGTFGNAAFFSFETIKPINTYGGGMIVTDDDSISEYARQEISRLEQPAGILKKVMATYLERLFFLSSLSFFPLLLLASKSGNCLMTSLYRSVQHAPTRHRKYSSIQAQLGLRKIKTLNERTGKRQEKAEKLKSLLPDMVKVQNSLPGAEPNYYFFVALLPEEAAPVRKHLLIRGFDAGIAGEIADNCAECMGLNDCPSVREVFDRTIHLPLHEGMDDHMIERLAALFRKRYS